MKHDRLAPLAKTCVTTHCPFFVVEFKSTGGGTDWVAENQNAGAGTHCVNSAETLFNYTKEKEKRQITKSAMFSCVAKVTDATIWVHWREM